MVHVMNTQVDCGTFADFNNFLFDLLFCFCNHFFDTGRVNTPIGYKLVQRQAGNLSANRIER